MQIVSLIKQAKHSIVLIDNYIDETTLTMLSKRDANVSATIYTRQLSSQQQLDIERHNQQYPPITVNISQRNHDRFLIIDDVVYLFGASPQQKNRARLTPGPVNSCFYCLIYKRTFYVRKGIFPLISGAGPRF